MCNEYIPHHLAGRQVEMRARLQILISKILTCAPRPDARRLSFSLLASLFLSTCPFTCTRKKLAISLNIYGLSDWSVRNPHPKTKTCPDNILPRNFLGEAIVSGISRRPQIMLNYQEEDTFYRLDLKNLVCKKRTKSTFFQFWLIKKLLRYCWNFHFEAYQRARGWKKSQ